MHSSHHGRGHLTFRECSFQKFFLPVVKPSGFLHPHETRASKQGFGEIVKSQWGGLKYDVQRRTQALWNCCYLLSFIPVHLSLKYPGLLNYICIDRFRYLCYIDSLVSESFGKSVCIGLIISEFNVLWQISSHQTCVLQVHWGLKTARAPMIVGFFICLDRNHTRNFTAKTHTLSLRTVKALGVSCHEHVIRVKVGSNSLTKKEGTKQQPVSKRSPWGVLYFAKKYVVWGILAKCPATSGISMLVKYVNPPRYEHI